MSKLKTAMAGILALSLFGMALAPNGASAQAAMTTYEVTITNLTSMQALSPPILITHPSSQHVWQVGQTASEGLRLVAEEGMNDTLAAEVRGFATGVAMADGPLMPGNSVTLRVQAHQGDVLSAATMLVQTNDGFTGLHNVALTGNSTTHDAMAYDAGTEENDEKASNVPGPPFGGHNSGVPTNPRQPISAHPGIRGVGDVGAEFNWSGPVARFTITMVGGAGTPMPSMPKTGAGDSLMWVLALGAAMLLAGLAVRRFQFSKR